jgi:hypothetical protein
MAKYNAESERIKRRYFGWLKEAKQCGEATVDTTAKTLSCVEEYNRFRDFKAYRGNACTVPRHPTPETFDRLR